MSTTIEELEAPTLADQLQALRPRLLSQARRRAYLPHEAEDLVQEAICRALSTDGLDLERLPAWLSVVLRNLAVDRARKDRHGRLVVETLSRTDPLVPDHSDAVLDRHVARTAESLVLQLPELDRHIIRAIAAGSSIREVADDMGISPKAVENRLRRSRRRLRRSIA